MIQPPDAVYTVIELLNDIGAPYFVTGSIASNAYSQPRATVDADFVVDMDAKQVERLRGGLSREFVPEEQMAFETVTGKIQHKFRHRASTFLVEVFEAEMSDPHERSRFDRRKPAMLYGRSTFFPTAEDVVVQKLRWFARARRPKDRDDVRLVLVHQMDSLDWDYVEHWCNEHGSLAILNELRTEADLFLKRK